MPLRLLQLCWQLTYKKIENGRRSDRFVLMQICLLPIVPTIGMLGIFWELHIYICKTPLHLDIQACENKRQLLKSTRNFLMPLCTLFSEAIFST